MTTVRQMFVSRVALLIIDSGNPDLSDIRLAGAIEGVSEMSARFTAYNEGVKLGTRAEKRLLNDVRKAVLKHPRYKLLVAPVSGMSSDELVKAAVTVKNNLEAKWRQINSDYSNPVQQYDQSKTSDFIANNYCILEVALLRTPTHG